LLPLRQSLVKLVAKQAVRVEKALNNGALFSETQVAGTDEQPALSVIERSELNP